MKIIIDTHIFLWALAVPSRISKKKINVLQSPTNSIYVSAVSIAELIIKASIRKIEIDFDPVDYAKQSGFELLDFSAQEALLLKDLPFHHRDPFDRMLICQSLSNDYPLMTDDDKIKQYNCRTL